MRRAIALTAFLVVAAAASGCTALSDFGRFTFGPGTDGGMGTGDTGVPDSGVDGGGIDAGPRDAGPDTGPHDAGPDAGPGDAGNDAGHDGGFDAGPRIPTGVVSTSGGAVVTTPAYRLRISIGAPQPIGDVSNTAAHLRVGPQSR